MKVIYLSCSYKTENIVRSRRNKIAHPLINTSILPKYFNQLSGDLAKISCRIENLKPEIDIPVYNLCFPYLCMVFGFDV
jgi:hypothetical protein